MESYQRGLLGADYKRTSTLRKSLKRRYLSQTAITDRKKISMDRDIAPENGNFVAYFIS